MPVTAWTAVVAGVLCLLLVGVSLIVTRSRTGLAAGGASTSAKDGWLLRAPLLPLVVAVVAGLVALYALLLLLAFGAEDFRLPTAASAANPVLVAATLVAGTLTAAYAVLRLRAHLLAETRSKLEAHGDVRADERHRSDREVALVERFSKAVALLAADQAISRIAGAHLILALGDEWPGGAQRCLDVLVSHLRGLRENSALEGDAVPRGMREEVRLIATELSRRISRGGEHWDVRAGDFSGTALDGFELQDAVQVAILDFRDAHILGDLSVPMSSSLAAPLLAGLSCDGDLSIECSPDWTTLDLSSAAVGGSVYLSGEVLSARLTAAELRVGGSLDLAFSEFRVDVVLDGADVDGEIRAGLPSLGAAFGDGDAPVELSLADASFERLSLQRLTRGPRLILSGAVGMVDLASSVFPFEVNANKLDASTGLSLRGARFESSLFLDGAKVPTSIDIDGLVLSDRARSAIESSDFALREQILAMSQPKTSPVAASSEDGFEWRSALEPFRERAGARLMEALESRFSSIDQDLPLDWRNKPSFAAQVASEVSRAFARADGPSDLENQVEAALRSLLTPLASSGATA